jgi:hypothetical protein
MINEYTAVSGIGETELLGGNLPQYHFPHDLTGDRSRATEVGSRRLKEDEFGVKQLFQAPLSPPNI